VGGRVVGRGSWVVGRGSWVVVRDPSARHVYAKDVTLTIRQWFTFYYFFYFFYQRLEILETD